jgi:hypothetical protein
MTNSEENPTHKPTNGGEPRVTLTLPLPETDPLSGKKRSKLYIKVEKDGKTRTRVLSLDDDVGRRTAGSEVEKVLTEVYGNSEQDDNVDIPVDDEGNSTDEDSCETDSP